MSDVSSNPGASLDLGSVKSQFDQSFAMQQQLSALQQDQALKQNILKIITENAVALAEALGEAGSGAAKNSKADAQSAARLFGQ